MADRPPISPTQYGTEGVKIGKTTSAHETETKTSVGNGTTDGKFGSKLSACVCVRACVCL